MNARTLPRRHFANHFASQSYPGRISPFFCLFFLLAVVFVPVPFGFGLADVWMPAGHGLVNLIIAIIQCRALDFFIGIVHVPFYLSLYFVIAITADALLQELRSRPFRRAIQACLLLLVFATSFASVIPYRLPQQPVTRGNFWAVTWHLVLGTAR